MNLYGLKLLFLIGHFEVFLACRYKVKSLGQQFFMKSLEQYDDTRNKDLNLLRCLFVLKSGR
jgi:hypothetical protein